MAADVASVKLGLAGGARFLESAVHFLAALRAMLRDVAVAVDGSASSTAAWAWAAESLLPLLRPGARCRLLCVAVPDDLDMALDDADAPWTIPADSELRREAQRRSAATAQDTLQRLLEAHPPSAAIRGVEIALLPVPLVGSVGESIAAALSQEPADLVVVGQRGMGSFKRCARLPGLPRLSGLSRMHPHACRSFMAGIADALAIGHMGSVSSYCVYVSPLAVDASVIPFRADAPLTLRRNLRCPVVVIKQPA